MFAKRRIRKGERIGTFKGPRTACDGPYVLWIHDEESGEVLGVRGRNGLRYLNHARRPNAEFDGFELFAVRRIRDGEEITLHYGADWDDVP